MQWRTGARMARALGFAPELLPISGVSRFECFDVAQATVSEIRPVPTVNDNDDEVEFGQ